MCTSYSSVSYSSQTKVTLLVKSSLVLVLVSFLGLESKAVVTSPVQVQRDSQGHGYCDFGTSGKMYNITDMLECMNELASKSVGKRITREAEKRSGFFPSSREKISVDPYNYIQYPPYSESQNDFYNQANLLNRSPQQTGNRPNFNKYPPALPPGYQLPSNSNFNPGILGVNLLNALSSLSQYDDRKCVPRILCEVATGVIPGSSRYKQNYAGFGMNSLISLLTALDTGTTSPLLTFGKSALMGYANKGNPGVCYQQYPRCPSNPSDLINYLNNHNGGFFRFFNNRNGGIRYRDVMKVLSPNYSERESDKSQLLPKDDALNDFDEQNLRVLFPDDHKSSNRVSKSLKNEQKTSFFPEGRTSQGHQINKRSEKQSLKSQEAKLYLPDNLPRQNQESFIFADRQRNVISVGFVKSFSEGVERNNISNLKNINPKLLNFEQVEIINLVNLYLEDEVKWRKIVHPCEMICHDSYGLVIKFNQDLNSYGLATIMTTYRQLTNFSKLLSCQIECNRNIGAKQKISTTLNVVFQKKKNEQRSPSGIIEKIKSIIQAGRVHHNIKPLLIKGTLQMSNFGVPMVGLAGGLGSLQKPAYLEQGPPVLKGEQGARVSSLGVTLFQNILRINKNKLTDLSINERNLRASTSKTIKWNSDVLPEIKKSITLVKRDLIQQELSHKFRPPVGPDYPEVSCLESESCCENDSDFIPLTHENVDESSTTEISPDISPSVENADCDNKVHQITLLSPQVDVIIQATFH